jgi:hypothetical protein
MNRGQEFGIPFSKSAQGSTSTVATETPAANQAGFITDISGSSDKAGATIIVQSASTVLWEEIIGNTAPYQHHFETPIGGVLGQALTVTVTGTSASNANMAGYLLNTP